MNVLLVGLNRDRSGYGEATRLLTSALLAAGVDLTLRTVHFSKPLSDKEVGAPVASAEGRAVADPDVVLQVLPPYAQEYVGPARNVGVFFTETAPLPAAWARSASLLDLQVAPCRDQLAWCRESPFWDVADCVLPVPCDAAKYARSYPRPKCLPRATEGRFLFYTIGELSPRKNLKGLLAAYCSEFKHWEPVGLVVKASAAGSGPDEVAAEVGRLVREAAAGAHMGVAPPVYVVSDRLSEAELCGLHTHCDCFALPSFGEGWCLPAVDAMGFGRTPILPAVGGPRDFMTEETGWLVPTRAEPCTGEADAHAALFTPRNRWHTPDPFALRAAMREAFSDPAGRAARTDAGVERALAFDLETVGRRWVEVLSGG